MVNSVPSQAVFLHMQDVQHTRKVEKVRGTSPQIAWREAASGVPGVRHVRQL